MRGAGETLGIQGPGVWSLLITLDTFGGTFMFGAGIQRTL